MKKLHWTQLVRGDNYLMASGAVAQLIGTEIQGDASFLFQYRGKKPDNLPDIVLSYPGLPGVKDEPIAEMAGIYKAAEEKVKEVHKEIALEMRTALYNEYLEEQANITEDNLRPSGLESLGPSGN